MRRRLVCILTSLGTGSWRIPCATGSTATRRLLLPRHLVVRLLRHRTAGGLARLRCVRAALCRELLRRVLLLPGKQLLLLKHLVLVGYSHLLGWRHLAHRRLLLEAVR